MTPQATQKPMATVRTRQHVVPANVPEGTVMTEHGWGTVAVNYRAWRSASAAKTPNCIGWRAVPDVVAEVELLRFQMVTDAKDGDGMGAIDFSDLVARGFVPIGEVEATLRAWCDRGQIPGGFVLRGGQGG